MRHAIEKLHEALDDEQRDKLHDSRVARIRIEADFRDVIVETCRRADRQGNGGEAGQRAFNRIAGRVIAAMAERARIRDPR